MRQRLLHYCPQREGLGRAPGGPPAASPQLPAPPPDSQERWPESGGQQQDQHAYPGGRWTQGSAPSTSTQRSLLGSFFAFLSILRPFFAAASPEHQKIQSDVVRGIGPGDAGPFCFPAARLSRLHARQGMRVGSFIYLTFVCFFVCFNYTMMEHEQIKLNGPPAR